MKRVTTLIAASLALLVSQHSLANETLVPWVGCDGLSWEAIDANVNVHRDTGEYLDTVPGSRGAWTAPETGSYYLVEVSGADWRDWVRTDTVYYERSNETQGGCVDPNLFTENESFRVLSETEIEFTWNLDQRYLDRYAHVEVMRFNDTTGDSETVLATGTRYYADDLSPDDSYTFALVNFDIYGVGGDSVRIYDGLNTREILDERNAEQLLAPLSLRAEVYSSSALEIFWQANIDFVPGETRYSVWLDHVLLTDNYNGGSLFVQNLIEGTSYDLSVVATRENFDPSEPVVVTAVTRGNGGGGGGQFSTVVVNGNMISWTDSGWYQVQDAITYESVCEGGSTCTVTSGMYIVINHHTGVRETVTVL